MRPPAPTGEAAGRTVPFAAARGREARLAVLVYRGAMPAPEPRPRKLYRVRLTVASRSEASFNAALRTHPPWPPPPREPGA